jgi:O-antigen ligase
LQRTTYYIAFASAVSILFSIALSQILLGLALALLLFSGEKLEFPPIRLPLAVFFLTTVAAVLASGDPQQGTPQLRKFFVFAILLVIPSAFRSISQVRSLILAWTAVATASAFVGVEQFVRRRHEALLQNADNYGYYVDGRITGFASHWMTFGGEEMMVLLMLVSVLLFSDQPGWKRYLWPAAIILWAAIALGMTRCIFLLGLPLGLAYLASRRRPLFLAAFFLGGAIGLLLAPAAVRERIVSVVKPRNIIDSNAHRAACRAVGWEMVRAHPWLGLGPEQVGKQFDRYIPANVSRPLPTGWYGHLHNIYLQYAAERGLLGLFAFLWLIGVVVSDFFKALRQPSLSKEARAVLNGALAVIIAVLAEGLFEYNLGDSEVLTIFLSVVACGYIVVREANRSAIEQVSAVQEVEGSTFGSASVAT